MRVQEQCLAEVVGLSRPPETQLHRDKNKTDDGPLRLVGDGGGHQNKDEQDFVLVV